MVRRRILLHLSRFLTFLLFLSAKAAPPKPNRNFLSRVEKVSEFSAQAKSIIILTFTCSECFCLSNPASTSTEAFYPPWITSAKETAVQQSVGSTIKYERGTSVCKSNQTIIRQSRSSCAWWGQMSASGCKRLLYCLQREPAASSPAPVVHFDYLGMRIESCRDHCDNPGKGPHERANWQRRTDHSTLICHRGKGHHSEQI